MFQLIADQKSWVLISTEARLQAEIFAGISSRIRSTKSETFYLWKSLTTTLWSSRKIDRTSLLTGLKILSIPPR